jgi:hypothetical protein
MFELNPTQLLRFSDSELSDSEEVNEDPDYNPPASPSQSVSSFSSLSETEEEEQPIEDNDSDNEFDQHYHLFQEAMEDRTPRSTKSSNAWALRTYARWAMVQSPKSSPGVYIPTRFQDIPLGRMNYVLSRFVQEAVDCNGYLYRPKTLYLLVAGLNRDLKERCAMTPNPDIDLLRTPMFKRFYLVLDGVLKHRQAAESPQQRKVDVFKQTDYDALWKTALGDKDPAQLLTTTIYMAMKVWSLRAGDELRRLTMNNFTFHHEDSSTVMIRSVVESPRPPPFPQ